MESLHTLKERLHDEDPYVRRDACEVMGETGKEGCVTELVSVLTDEDAGVKEAAVNALTSIGGHEVAEKVAPLLRSDDASLRNMGIEILEQVGPEALDVIFSLLGDSDDDVVKFAVDILASIREERAVEKLGPLMNHSNPNVRGAVAVCLGRIKARSAAPVLMGALNDSEDWVRFSVIEGLGCMEEKEALEPLLEVMDRGSLFIKDSAVEAVSRIAAAQDAPRILGKIARFIERGDMLPVGAVVELLEKATLPGSRFRPDDRFREIYSGFLSEAMSSQGKEGGMKALRGLATLKMPEALARVFEFTAGLKELDEDTEDFLVDIIVAMVGRGELPVCLTDELARGGKNFRIIIRALGELKAAEALPVLEGMVDRVATHELREIVAAIDEIGSPGSERVLYTCLASSDGHSRKIAARALAKLAGDNAVESLFSTLKKERYRDVLEEITDVLAMIPSLEVVDGFTRLLEEDEDHLREMAARGLGLIGSESAVPPLSEATRDSSAEVRQAAYTSLTRLGVPEAQDLVIRGLKDDDDEVKLSVMKALGGWEGQAIEEAVVEALADRNMWVRYQAVHLLAESENREAVEECLVGLLLKDEAPVKAACAKALEKTGSPRCLPALEKFIDHPDPSVRAAVENAIEALAC